MGIDELVRTLGRTSSLIGRRVRSVVYWSGPSGSWSDNQFLPGVHETASEVTLEFDGNLTLSIAWAQDGFIEGLDARIVDSTAFMPTVIEPQPFDASRLPAWSELMNRSMKSAAFAAQQMDDGIETGWAIRLQFEEAEALLSPSES